MHCIKKITDDLIWVGANDRRLALFEGVYSVPEGVSYNSYLLTDEKTVLFDTVDKAVQERFLENLAKGLAGRPLDYLILHHIEPDHSAAIAAVLARYPEITLVLNKKSADFLAQFYDLGSAVKTKIVAENDTLNTGKHTLHFVMAPMVHWPEVMVSYDAYSRILFSADAFGNFGSLNGAMFADEVDYSRDYLDKARRYYTNIVGKYGAQVQTLLKKASALTIDMICPLHGFVWRKNLGDILTPYTQWSNYEPEEQGVMIAYASVYGNTENAAEILACRLRDLGIKTVMFDVSVADTSEIVAAAFRWSHLVFASTTYNAGIFITMEAVIYDLVAHNIQNRTVALIENGSWAATSGNLMSEKLKQCKNIQIIGNISIKSGVKPDKAAEIIALADALAGTFPKKANVVSTDKIASGVDAQALQKIPYGLFLISAKDGDKDNACIVNTVSQITVSPVQISVAINKDNLTHDIIKKTGELAVSVLTQAAPFGIFEHFGLSSGKNADKFGGINHSWANALVRTENGLYALADYANAIIAGKVISTVDCGTHTIFIAQISQAKTLSDTPACTYQYYFDHIKPKPQPIADKNKSGYVCKICGYIYEGDVLPPDFICPLCKHGAADFERV
ncbi:MAG: flavin reductase [Chitinivibrionia bacterium]|nr:flavin reductase [Chitinivibrionia bacterium]